MSDVFVSYKAEDRRRVKPLVDALEADGFSVWWDEQIGGGAAWRHEIETQLNAARCVIVIWSKRSVGPEGTFVHDEATRAQHDERRNSAEQRARRQPATHMIAATPGQIRSRRVRLWT